MSTLRGPDMTSGTRDGYAVPAMLGIVKES